MSLWTIIARQAGQDPSCKNANYDYWTDNSFAGGTGKMQRDYITKNYFATGEFICVASTQTIVSIKSRHLYTYLQHTACRLIRIEFLSERMISVASSSGEHYVFHRKPSYAQRHAVRLDSVVAVFM